MQADTATGIVLGFTLVILGCAFVFLGKWLNEQGPHQIQQSARNRAISQGLAHYHPTVADSLVYSDERVRIIVEGE